MTKREDQMITKQRGSCAAFALLCLTPSSVFGDGFASGDADLSGLLGGGNFFAADVTYISPDLSFGSVDGVTTTGLGAENFAEPFALPSFTYQHTFGDTACGLGGHRPYTLLAEFGDITIDNGLIGPGDDNTRRAEVSSYELALTCSYGYSAGPGTAYAIGGVFYEQVTLDRTQQINSGPGGIVTDASRITLDGGDFGYRLGVGYAISDIALKGSIVYRSAVDHRLDGTQSFADFAGFGPLAGSRIGAYTELTTPESVRLSFQTGVHPEWLILGAVEWTNWSDIQTIDALSGQDIPEVGISTGDPAPGEPQVETYFRDGLSVELGVGHVLNERTRLGASVLWDRGTGTGESAFFDTWRVGVGGEYDLNDQLTLNGGIAVAYIEGGTYVDGRSPGASTLVQDDGTAVGINLGLRYSF